MNLIPIMKKLKLIFFAGIILFLDHPVSAQQDSLSVVTDSVSRYTDSIYRHDNPSVADKYFDKRWDTLNVELRSVPQNARKKISDEDELWYANSNLKKSKRQIQEEKRRGQNAQKNKNAPAIRERKSFFIQPWFQSLLWIIIITGFAFFLIIYLSGSNVGLFRKKIRAVQSLNEMRYPRIFMLYSMGERLIKLLQPGTSGLPCDCIFFSY